MSNDTYSAECLISIIIATYNSGDQIAACLSSVSSVTVPVEIIVVDGGSTDQTLTILEAYRGHQLKYVSEPDRGIYDALNKGIDRASGKWLHFLGSDDRLLPGFNELAAKLKDTGTVYYGNSVPFYSDGISDSYGLLRGPFSAYRLAKYCMNHQSILYPASAFKSQKYNLKYKVFADYAFNIRLWGDRHFSKEFHAIDLVSYHMGGFSAQHQDAAFSKDKLSLIRKGMGISIFLRYVFRNFKDVLKRNQR